MDMVAGRVWADERRPIRHVDWVLVLLTVVLTVVGLVLLHSISATTPGEAAFWLVRVMKHGATAGFGLLFVALIAAFDYRFFKVYAGFIYVAALVGMLIVAGTRLKHLLVLTAVGLVLIGLAFQLGVIQDFQRQRLTAFLDRANVSEDARYNLDQSLIAVGSGGLFGRGYLKGTQTN